MCNTSMLSKILRKSVFQLTCYGLITISSIYYILEIKKRRNVKDKTSKIKYINKDSIETIKKQEIAKPKSR